MKPAGSHSCGISNSNNPSQLPIETRLVIVSAMVGRKSIWIFTALFTFAIQLAAILIVAVLLAQFIYWLDRSRSLQTTGPVAVMDVPWPYKGIFVTAFILFAGLIALSVYDTAEKEPVVLIILAIFAAFFLGGTLEAFVTKLVPNPNGLDYKLPEKHGFLAWSDVQTVKYGLFSNYFKVRTKDGRQIRISAGLNNLPVFAEHVLKHVPTTNFDPADLKTLMETARGNPPSLFD